MPRRCRMRVRGNPDATFFKPAGFRRRDIAQTELTIAEYEALRLKDVEELDQTECAERMGVSQPTFHRLITTARRKVADAIVTGKSIKINNKT